MKCDGMGEGMKGCTQGQALVTPYCHFSFLLCGNKQFWRTCTCLPRGSNLLKKAKGQLPRRNAALLRIKGVGCLRKNVYINNKKIKIELLLNTQLSQLHCFSLEYDKVYLLAVYFNMYTLHAQLWQKSEKSLKLVIVC